MDLSLTADQEALRSLARQVLTDHATPERLREVEASDERMDRRLWAALAQAGLLGVAIPEEYGGSGLGLVELYALLEEVGRTVAPVPVYPTLLLGALPVAKFGTPAQREALLPGVARGELVLSGALAEPRNPDPLRPSTRATAAGDGWRLDGVKLGVAAARDAAAIVVPAAVDGSTALFLVDPTGTGVSLEAQEVTNRELQFLMTLSDAPAEQLSGGADALRWLVRRASVGLCAMQVGVTERALRMTGEYVSTREQFGRPLSAFQAVSQRAADAYIDVEAIRLTTQAAIWQLAEGLDADASIAVAKYWAAEGGQRVVHAAQHLHGGVGVDVSYPLHRYFLWAKQLELSLGGGTEQLLRLGQMIATSV